MRDLYTFILSLWDVLMFHLFKDGQYWVWASEWAYEYGFMPRFKCDNREQLERFYDQNGLVIGALKNKKEKTMLPLGTAKNENRKTSNEYKDYNNS